MMNTGKGRMPIGGRSPICRYGWPFLGLSILALPAAFAGVNLKNGNFHISYTDCAPSGVQEVDISRTYNSKSTRIGWFGFGWGSAYETAIDLPGDGRVIVREYGSGATTVFRPAAIDRHEIDAMVDLLIGVGDQANSYSDGTAREVDREKLRQDSELRSSRWMRALDSGHVRAREIPVGTLFRSEERGIQSLLRTHSGYLRINGDDRHEFDSEGRLVSVTEGNKGVVRLERDGAGVMRRIVLENGDAIDFSFDAGGQVRELKCTDQGRARYDYQGSDLVRAIDIGGNDYRYRYDERVNLVEVAYSDGTTTTMTYWGGEFGGTGTVRSVTDRERNTTWYTYGSDPAQPDDHYYTEVASADGGEPDRYEYWIQTLPDGGRYTGKVLTRVNGVTTTTTYNQAGLPLEIQRGSRTTRFEYDGRGRITFKDDGTLIQRMSYHQTLDKLVDVRQWHSGTDEEVGHYRFDYDALGNLTEADDGELHATLTYDDTQTIRSVKIGGKTLNFHYNELRKPDHIEVENIGSIDVVYDEDGEISSVNSRSANHPDEPGGYQVTLQVTQAFQQLLSLVKPAGVDLGM